MLIGLILALQAFGPPQPPPFVPPKTQSARCTGVDELDHPQTLTLVSRWVEAEHSTVLFVEHDSSGTLKDGEWLENANRMYSNGDRKHGILLDWHDTYFTRHVGDQFVGIAVTEHGEASATVVYIKRRYSENDETPTKYLMGGTVMLVGHCTLFVEGEKRTSENEPRLGPVPR